MKSTLNKILKFPEASWDWNPDEPFYSEFSDDEEDDIIAIINEEHLNELDEEEISPLLENASIHAYRILASFLNPNHITLFIDWLFSPEIEDDDLFHEDSIKILQRYKSDAVQPCIAALNDQRLPEQQRMYICEVLISLKSDNIQSEIITQLFCDYLTAKHFSRTINALIISNLSTQETETHIKIIKGCFDDHLVDLSFSGDFEEVEIKIGTRKERRTPCTNFFKEEEKEIHLAIKKSLGPRPSEKDPSGLFIYLLNLYSIDQSITDYPAIDGYLTAILLNPIEQEPSDFLPQFWDLNERYSPKWDEISESLFFTDFILAVQNKILGDLQCRDLHPMLDNKQNHPLYSTWIHGFLRGFHVRYDDETLPELEGRIITNLFKILTKELNVEGSNKPPKTKALVKDLNITIYKLFKQNYTNQLLTKQPNPLATTKKKAQIPRNAPCSCGSGKKYKRCCMN